MPLPRIGVTMGDPAGVGPELCLRLLADRKVADFCVPLVYGSAALLRKVAAHSGLPVPAETIAASKTMEGELPLSPAVIDVAADSLLPVELDDFRPGEVSAATGRLSLACVEAAVADALRRRVAAIATGPIHKEAISAAGCEFPGHTELLAARTSARRHCMMLTSREITCTFVTGHVPLRDVPALLSQRRITEVIDLTNEALRPLLRRPPRLVICGLNPHAGEHGLFGDEEQRIIAPAARAALERGLAVIGPLPPDTAFLPARRVETDAYICMYHDQGLIPLKALAFDTAVNVTLGLPIIRTSVDHGTAIDIAWRGTADPSSFLEAVRLAARLAALPAG